MTASPTGIFPTYVSAVKTGGTAITIMYGPVLGGFIVNPLDADDQGLSVAEPLYIDVVTTATLGSLPTSTMLAPGQTYSVPPNQSTSLSVNAATSGHKFSAITFQPQIPDIPADLLGIVNPCLQELIPSYLYVQYQDDDDLQAWVSAFNQFGQAYVDWVNDTPLPVYTSDAISGTLLDWVAVGLYGVARPVLSAGNVIVSGLFNTFELDAIVMNGGSIIDTTTFTPVNDDIYKRILTWQLYKGDGKVMNVRWLKRRIYRFLAGINGTDPNAGDTTGISVEFDDDTTVTITVLHDEFRNTGLGGAFNTNAFNSNAFNQGGSTRFFQTLETFTHGNHISIEVSSSFVDAPTFKQAIEQGILDMPFQFTVSVTIV